MDELERELSALTVALATADLDAIHAVLKRTVEGYVPDRRHLDVPASPGASQGAAVSRVLH